MYKYEILLKDVSEKVFSGRNRQEKEFVGKQSLTSCAVTHLQKNENIFTVIFTLEVMPVNLIFFP